MLRQFQIMIVDDDPFMLNLIGNDLELAGYLVITADTGLKAMSMLKTNQVDIVITDIVMPDMDGIGLIMALRQQYPNISIFAMSSGGRISDNYEYLNYAKGLGADEVFGKPVDTKALLAKLEQYCQNSAGSQA